MILKTKLFAKEGEIVEITDFCPKFRIGSTTNSPSMLIRIITPINCSPSITIRCRPSFHYNSIFPTLENGANHIKYEGPGIIARLQTNIPVSYILDEVPFVLQEEKYIIICGDEPLTKSV